MARSITNVVCALIFAGFLFSIFADIVFVRSWLLDLRGLSGVEVFADMRSTSYLIELYVKWRCDFAAFVEVVPSGEDS